ncbi:hypothetical protein OKA05_08315 [Luteolibacter arcticus]|uniref:Uncharacterized protein n=1 Tax=Luteolibacter arcticus TaxID=1581411 RepID=A0ABT3GG17_9BACT|nr:hypothetical protein [Luteolibacter arcticus]MCW1922556.1 hypothetical protein [Luteolibacter arcticus]
MASLMLMVVITLLAVGLLGLSTIEVRKSGLESARLRGQAPAQPAGVALQAVAKRMPEAKAFQAATN